MKSTWFALTKEGYDGHAYITFRQINVRPACPERHLTVAELMGANISNVVSPKDEAGEILADEMLV